MRKSSSRTVRLSGFLQGINEPYQLLGGMRNGDVVVLALCPFSGEINSKVLIPMANVLGGVEESEPQVSGAALFHVGIAISKLPGLVCGGRETCVLTPV